MTVPTNLIDGDDPAIYDLRTHGPGPEGRLPLTAEQLRESPSGDIFGLTQDVGMGWRPEALGGPEVLILSTQGGIRAPDGTPLALGYHTGHWEVGLLMQAAADDVARPRCRAVRRFRHRSVRRPNPGHDRHDGQPALSQRRRDGAAPADPLAADPQGRPRRRNLRQGAAGDDDGAGVDAPICHAC